MPSPRGIGLCSWRFEVCAPKPPALPFSSSAYWSSLKATSRVRTPGLIFYLTQRAPCLVYKLILCYFQVSNKNEPENSFLQDCWIFSCVIEFGFVEAEIGGREVTERHSFSPPNLYVPVSKCHYSEKILFNCNVIISYIRLSLGSGWYLLWLSFPSAMDALLYFSSTSSYLFVMDFCKPNYILPLRTILTVYLQHPFQKGLIIIDRGDRETDSQSSGQLNHLLYQFTLHRSVVEQTFMIRV